MILRHWAMWSLAAVGVMPFLQSLHWCSWGASSRGRPVLKVSIPVSSRSLIRGPGETAVMAPSLSFFLSSGGCGQRKSAYGIGAFGLQGRREADEPSATLASLQLLALLCFGEGLFSLSFPNACSLEGAAAFLAEATFMVASSSAAAKEQQLASALGSSGERRTFARLHRRDGGVMIVLSKMWEHAKD